MGLADDAHLVGGQPQDRSACEPHEGRRLIAPVTGDASLDGIPLADDAEGLDRIRSHAIPAELLGEHLVRALEDLLHLSPGEHPLEHHVVSAFLEEQGAPRFHRLPGIGHHLQRLVVHDDLLECVLGDVPTGGGDGRHRLANEAHLFRRQAVAAPALGRGGRREAPTERVFAADHGCHTRQRLRRADVDGRDARVGERTAENRAVQHAGQAQVVDERGATGEKLRILDPVHRLAHPAGRARGKVFQPLRDLDGHVLSREPPGRLLCLGLLHSTRLPSLL